MIKIDGFGSSCANLTVCRQVIASGATHGVGWDTWHRVRHMASGATHGVGCRAWHCVRRMALCATHGTARNSWHRAQPVFFIVFSSPAGTGARRGGSGVGWKGRVTGNACRGGVWAKFLRFTSYVRGPSCMHGATRAPAACVVKLWKMRGGGSGLEGHSQSGNTPCHARGEVHCPEFHP
jgi:hypothetical protein